MVISRDQNRHFFEILTKNPKVITIILRNWDHPWPCGAQLLFPRREIVYWARLKIETQKIALGWPRPKSPKITKFQDFYEMRHIWSIITSTPVTH